MTVFHVTRCIAGPRAYGGFNRSQQIVESLARHGITCAPVDLFASGFGARSTNLRAGLALALRRNFPPPRSYARVWIAGHYTQLLQAARLLQPTAKPVLIWENTEDDLLAHAAAQLGIKVVALPHDLVALNRPDSGHRWSDLQREIRGLAHSQALFAISLEERWLLRLLGNDAHSLPYHPPAALEAGLLRTRQQRRPGPDAPILILGSAANPQTRAGLERQLQLLRDAGPLLGRKVILAGNDTGALASLAGPDVCVRGAVSDEILSKLMAEAAVLWTYQSAGTGALTRIVESLVAGLPVAGGGVALRSTGDLSDVYPVETVAELKALLPRLPRVALQPQRPLAREQELAEQVKAWA